MQLIKTPNSRRFILMTGMTSFITLATLPAMAFFDLGPLIGIADTVSSVTGIDLGNTTDHLRRADDYLKRGEAFWKTVQRGKPGEIANDILGILGDLGVFDPNAKEQQEIEKIEVYNCIAEGCNSGTGTPQSPEIENGNPNASATPGIPGGTGGSGTIIPGSDVVGSSPEAQYAKYTFRGGATSLQTTAYINSVLGKIGQERSLDQLTTVHAAKESAVSALTHSAQLSAENQQFAGKSETLAGKSQAVAQRANGRKASQDILKDLAELSQYQSEQDLMVSGQLANLSAQTSIQSGQLAAIATQNGTQSDLLVDLKNGQAFSAQALQKINQDIAELNATEKADRDRAYVSNRTATANAFIWGLPDAN